MIDVKDIPLLVFRRLATSYWNKSKPQKINRNGQEYDVLEINDKGFIAYTEYSLSNLGSKSTRFEIWHRLPEKNEQNFLPKIEIRGAPFLTGNGPGREYQEQAIVLFPPNISANENNLSEPVWILLGEAITIASGIASSSTCEKGAIYWEEDRFKKLKTKT